MLATAFFVSTFSWANFSVSPLKVELNSHQTSTSFLVSNIQAGERLIELRIYEWNRVAGKDQLIETTDFIANPQIFKLPEKGHQTVRFGLVSTIKEIEKTYRIIFTELPANNANTGLVLAFEFSIPVIVKHANCCLYRYETTLESTTKTGTIVKLTNSGNALFQVLALESSVGNFQPLEHRSHGRLFPGESQKWFLPGIVISLEEHLTLKTQEFAPQSSAIVANE